MRSGLISLCVLVFASLNISASATPDDIVTVHADAHGTGKSCGAFDVQESCPFTWDTNGTSTLGDDQIDAAMFVDEVRIAIRPPVGDSQPQQFSVDPRDVSIHHPVNQEVNETWLQVNDTRPDATKPFISFDSRPMRNCRDGQWVDGDKWAISINVYPPVSATGCDSVAPFTWCWQLCFLNNQTYLVFTDDGVEPFPNGVFLGRDNGTGAPDSDNDVHSKFSEAEYCMGIPLVPCNTAPMQPVIQEANDTYTDSTPNVGTEFQYNRTSVAILPAHDHDGLDTPLASNVSSSPESPPSQVTWNVPEEHPAQRQASDPVGQQGRLRADFALAASDRAASVDASTTTDPVGQITDYAWNWDDGETSHGQTATHTYAPGRSYTIRLTVTDDRGFSDDAWRTIYVPTTKTESVVQVHVPPTTPVASIMLVGGAATAFLALAWFLYSRISRHESLSQGTRRRVFEFVEANPGASIAQAARALGIGENTTKYHMWRLEASGNVKRGSGRRPTPFFATGRFVETLVVEALAHPPRRRVLAFVVDRGEADLSTIASGTGLTLNAVDRALTKLVPAGLATRARSGRHVVVRPSSTAASALGLPAVPPRQDAPAVLPA